jgi:hypothetical protein
VPGHSVDGEIKVPRSIKGAVMSETDEGHEPASKARQLRSRPVVTTGVVAGVVGATLITLIRPELHAAVSVLLAGVGLLMMFSRR